MSQLVISQIGHRGILCHNAYSACIIDPFIIGSESVRPLQEQEELSHIRQICKTIILTGSDPSLLDFRSLKLLLPDCHLFAPSNVIDRVPDYLLNNSISINPCKPWQSAITNGFEITFIPGLNPKKFGVLVKYNQQCIWNLGASYVSASISARVKMLIDCPHLVVLNGSFDQGLRVAVSGNRSFPYARLEELFTQARILSKEGWERLLIVGGLSFSGRALWKQYFEYPLSRDQLISNLIDLLPRQCILSGRAGAVYLQDTNINTCLENPSIIAPLYEVPFDPTRGIPSLVGDGIYKDHYINRIISNVMAKHNHPVFCTAVALFRQLGVLIEFRIVSAEGTNYIWLKPDAGIFTVYLEEPKACEGICNRLHVAISATGLDNLLEGTETPERLALEDHIRVSFNPVSVSPGVLRSSIWLNDDFVGRCQAFSELYFNDHSFSGMPGILDILSLFSPS